MFQNEPRRTRFPFVSLIVKITTGENTVCGYSEIRNRAELTLASLNVRGAHWHPQLMRGEAALVSEARTSEGLDIVRPARARLSRRDSVCMVWCDKNWWLDSQSLISIYSLRFSKCRDIFLRWIFPDTDYMDIRHQKVAWSWFDEYQEIHNVKYSFL